MLVYRIDDMTCGHCASVITKAVHAVDTGAKVDIDIGQHLVSIEPTEADAAELHEAITEAGYTPVAVEPQAAARQAAKAGGCCGGCCGG